MIKQLLEKTLSISLLILSLSVVIVAQDIVGGGTARRETRGRLQVIVTGGGESKPVNGADVLVRWQTGDKLFEESTKTDSQGVANISSVPHGTILVQITALGWKTSGLQFDFKNESPIPVHLEQEQKEPHETRPT